MSSLKTYALKCPSCGGALDVRHKVDHCIIAITKYQFKTEKEPSMLKVIYASILVALLTACSSNEILRAPVNVSVGQQLIDLKKAHDSGALSKREYDDQREKLIDSVK
jgi:hypothetical protein